MKRIGLKGLLLPLIFCILCIGCYFILERSRIGSHPVDNLENLLIENTDLPTGWTFQYEIPITGDYDYGESNIMIAFSREPELGFARQYVYHFRNSLAAAYSYYFLSKDLPLVRNNQVNFLDYGSRSADAWYMTCKESDSQVLVCDTLSRYDDFIIYFSISTKRDLLTPAQLMKILVSIEAKIEKQLRK